MSSIPESTVARFRALYSGFDEAFGTGKGRWIQRPPTFLDWSLHLSGGGEGLGIGPLRRDGTCSFAAVDLDEPDYDAALLIQDLVPGVSFIERSRSGNYHVLVFFDEPIAAWIPRAILRHAAIGASKPRVEVFPKQDTLREGMLGNYINAAYHGESRPIVIDGDDITLDQFLDLTDNRLTKPHAWIKRAATLGFTPRERVHREAGTRQTPHECAVYIIANREDNPLQPGGRNVVLFNLAKMLHDCEAFDTTEVLRYVSDVNEAGVEPLSPGEIRRIVFSAKRGGYTSTGCDDPLMAEYIDPDCRIAAHARSTSS